MMPRPRKLAVLRSLRWWPSLVLLLLAVPAQAQQAGSFTAVSYNVAALPSVPPVVVPCCDPLNSIPIIAANVFSESWDIVAFQEAFVHGPNSGDNLGSFYYDTLMGNSTPVAFQFTTADTAATNTVASGLGKLSEVTILPFSDGDPTVACEDALNDPMEFCRRRWDMLTGADAISDKGYSRSRHVIAPMVYLDVYNLHAQAGGSNSAERADNIGQLIAEINTRSEGIAVLVLGDTNSTYDRQNDVIRDMLTNTTGTGGQDDPLVDVWLELVRDQSVPIIPTQGGTPLFPCDELGDPAEQARTEWAGPNCEWRDKIFYRGSADLSLTAISYFVITDYLNLSGDDLSDHYPTGASFDYVVPEPGVALQSLAALGTLGWLSRHRRRA